jgi:spoIIIJ-associated protein
MSKNRTTIEIIAPSIEEAIDKGLAQLGLSEEHVEIEILDEGTKGLFGLGSRQARVKLTIMTASQPDIHPLGVTEPTPAIDSPETVESEQDQVLSVARETVSDLLKKMNVKAEVVVYYGEPDDSRSRAPVCVDIKGQDLSILIGRKAETLDALQFITKLIMGKELEQSVPLLIDVEGYRKRRQRQVRKLAQRVAEQVKQTGRSQTLEPMPPNERRWVHIELRENPAVFTESTGEGKRRKVVVYPKD